MPLNIKNQEVERLAAELAAMTGQSKTQAIRQALETQRARLAQRLAGQHRAARLRRVLRDELWPHVPEQLRGRRLERQQREALLAGKRVRP